MEHLRKSLILLTVFAVLVLGGCAAQSATGLSEMAVETVALAEETLVVITLQPVTPVPVMQTPAATATTSAPTATPEPALTPSPTPSPEYELINVKNVDGYVGALSVNLRNGPGTDYDVIGEYECNTLLLITAKTDEWYQVEIEDKTGFMLKEFIGVGAIPMPTPEPTKRPASKTTAKPTSKPEPTATPKPAEATNGGVGSYSASEVLLTAQIVYKESRQGDYDGYRAVANVILNRVQSGIFRSTIEGVIFQGNGAQFGPANDEAALRAVKPSSTCIEAVQAVLGGDTILPSNAYYFRPASKGESWSSHKYVATYGGNAFFS